MIKFVKGYYLCMITQRKKIARIGMHDIYQIKDIKMIPLFTWTKTKMRFKEEKMYIDLFLAIKINEGFYFSYTYNLTHTLQNNMIDKIKKQQRKNDDNEAEVRENNFIEAADESSDSE